MGEKSKKDYEDQNPDKEANDDALTKSTTKKTKASILRQKLNQIMSFSEHIKNTSGNRPAAREGAGMVLIEDTMFLGFGVACNIYSDIYSLNLKLLKWNKHILTGDDIKPRYGHSFMRYKENKILIFGGCGNYEVLTKMRNCYNDLFLVDINTFNCENIKAPNQHLVPKRAHHASFLIGNNFFIHGGVNEKNQYYSDFWYYNFNLQKWREIKVNGLGPGKIAWHTSAPILPMELVTSPHIVNVYDINPSIYNLIFNKKVKYPGIYFFGGKNSKDQLQNTLWVLKFEKNLIQWEELSCSGKHPSPRCFHTMEYLRENQTLIVIGGRSNKNTPSSEAGALNLGRLEWSTITVYGNSPLPRISHCSISYDTKVVIIGGIGKNIYSTMDPYRFEFQERKVRELIREYKKIRHLELKENKAKILQNLLETPQQSQTKTSNPFAALLLLNRMKNTE